MGLSAKPSCACLVWFSTPAVRNIMTGIHAGLSIRVCSLSLMQKQSCRYLLLPDTALKQGPGFYLGVQRSRALGCRRSGFLREAFWKVWICSQPRIGFWQLNVGPASL